MNGIVIPKKRLSPGQVHRLIKYIEKFPSKLQGEISFADKVGVGVSSVKSAKTGSELSEQIINKIIKAL